MNYDAQINTKTIFGSLGWKTLERVTSQGINLVIQIILARILLPKDFGSLAIIVVITNYASIFVQSGLATAVVQKKDLDDLDISTLLTASLTVALVLYIVLFVLSPTIADFYDTPELTLALRILALILFLNAINSIQTAIFSRRMQFKRLFLRSMIAVPVSGFVGITMAYLDFGIWALVAQNLTNTLVVVIVMCIGTDMSLRIRFSWERAKKIYSFSGKILISSLISGMNDTIRTMTIGRKYSSQQLAYYDKAYTYSYYATQIINGSIASVLLPVFSRNQTKPNELKSLARQSIRLSAFFIMPFLLGLAVVAKSLVIVLLTEKWIASVPYLTVFCILRLPGCIMLVDKQVYYALGRSGINLVYETGLCVVNLFILTIMLSYGTMAIAVGAMMVEFLGSVAIFYISACVYGYSLTERMSDLWRPTLNSLVMVAFVWAIRFANLSDIVTLLIQIPLGVFVYVLLSKMMKDQSYYYTRSILIGILKKDMI